MKLQRMSVDEKREFIAKVDELAKAEKISVKEACKRLDIPYWKYFNALKGLKKTKKNRKVAQKGKAAAKIIPVVTANGELKVELLFKGDTATLIRDYAVACDVEPEIVCRIMVIDSLKDKR
jgi:uncharacterized radical SAM superfamily protein